MTSLELSAAQARRMALAAQGFADKRPTGRVDRRHLRRVFDRINVVQVDSVNVLVRSQELPLFARLGPHPRTMLADAIDDGELFEYWAHMAAIVPSAQQPLFRWRMDAEHQWKRITELGDRRPDFIDEVIARIRDDGPITAADLEQRTGKKGPWWDWDDGKIVLEHLFQRGRLAGIRRRRDFARLYDLPERVLPAAVLARPTPPEAEARKALLELAARSTGVATVDDLSDYHRQARQVCQPLVAELVEEGVLRPASVEGWSKAAYVHRDAIMPRAVRARALLSPFDSLVWYRDRTERLFDFHYRIEIYVPAPKRTYGYYVLPYLLGDELIGRVDLKADRAAGVLRVQGAYTEPGVDGVAAAGNLVEELRSMAGWLELDTVATTGRGDLGSALRREGVPEVDADVSPLRERSRRYAPHVSPEPESPQSDDPGDMPPPDEPALSAASDPVDGAVAVDEALIVSPSDERRLPRWVVPAVIVFWAGFLGALAVRFFWGKLNPLVVLIAISVFLALAIEPGVNRLARRGWRRGSATALILFGVLALFAVFVIAIGTLVGSQVADLLSNSEDYITDTVNTINDTFGTNLDAEEVIADFNDPDGSVQRFIRDQQDNAVRLSVAALGGLLKLFSVLLFTFYLVADGPKMRRAICSRLTPARQERVLRTWELAGDKTGGYLYSRALLALISATFHWIVFQAVGTPAPVALALWVGVVSQFLPVVGTYLAGILPVLLTFLDSPLKALIVLIAIVVYQQIENYLFSPRITARTMELHPAVAFGSALAGAAVLGAIGAVLALPAAAMGQALISDWGDRHQVIRNELTDVRDHRVWKRWQRIRRSRS